MMMLKKHCVTRWRNIILLGLKHKHENKLLNAMVDEGKKEEYSTKVFIMEAYIEDVSSQEEHK